MSELYTYAPVGDGVKNHGKTCVSSEWLTEGRALSDNID